MAQIRANQMDIDANKPECQVDQFSTSDFENDLKNCEVVQSDLLAADGETKLYYDTVMIKIDVKASYYGVNSFYVI